jgi:hypothetical protein
MILALKNEKILVEHRGVVFHGSPSIDLLLRKWFPLLNDFEELPTKEPNVVEAVGEEEMPLIPKRMVDWQAHLLMCCPLLLTKCEVGKKN